MDTAPVHSHVHHNALNAVGHVASEKQLSDATMKNYQQYIEDLQRKLRLTTDMCAEQEVNYKNAFNDMELKFRRTLSQRDEFIKLRESESNNQQQLINHLQSALDKTETEKSVATKNVTELTNTLQNTEEQKQRQCEELELFKTSFKNISMVLIPDLRKLSNDDDLNELNITSASKMLEKVLLLHHKEKEMLNFKLQNLESKVLQNDKINEEKVNYEKKIVEVQYQEKGNVYVANMESKNQEIQQLNARIKTLENEKTLAQQKQKEEIKQHNKTLENFIEENNKKYNRVCKERDDIQKQLLALQSEHVEFVELIKQLKNDLETQKKNNYMHSKERTEKDERIVHLQKEKEHIQIQLKDVEIKFQELKLSLNLELEAVKKDLLLKNEQIEEATEKQKQLQEQLIVVPAEVDEKVRKEEKKIYENEMHQINTVIEDHKSILQKANINIEQKNQVIKDNNREIDSLQNQLAASEQQTFVLKNEVKNHTTVLDQKDNRIINLQLKISEFNEQLKASKHIETHCSKALEDAKTLNINYHQKLELCEKEKQDLIETLQKEKYQSTIFQKELEINIKVVSERNEAIEKLRKDLKQVAHKLKGKHEQISTKEKEMKNLEADLSNLKYRQNKMDKNLQKFQTKNEALTKELSKVNKENIALMKLVEEKEDIQEKEVLNLLNRLQGSQADILKLKKMLQKSSGFNAVKVASATQNIVTKQRAEFDSLKTKMAWLKEALEVSEQTRMKLQEQTSASDENQHHLHQQLLEAEQKNHELSINLTMCKQEIHELHVTLEQTVKKYADVYALVEKQEKCLTDDRKHYDSKLKEIRQTFQKPLPIEFVNHLDYPHNITRSSTAELRNLLEDVKCLLSSTLKKNLNIKEQLSSTQVNDNNDVVTKHSQSQGQRSQQVTVRPEKSQDQVIVISPNSSIGSNTQKLNEYLSKHSFNESSLSLLNFSKESTKQKGLKQNLPIFSTPKEVSSPNIDADVEDEVASVYSNVDYSGDSTIVSATDSTACSVAGDTTEESTKGLSSVQRLQEKLVNLKQMGEDLTTNNREINNLMVKHSKKLRKLGSNQL